LKTDPLRMQILGDGKQCKSYFHVSDCIDAMVFGLTNQEKQVEIFNVGSKDYIDVTELAGIVADEMKLKNVIFEYTGGTKSGAGWVGDVKVMMLSVEALKAKGWSPMYTSADSIRLTARSLLE
jgi:UDP-glucose 4-epimerase